MENFFNYDDFPGYTNIYKEFDQPISGGKFAFSLYNVTNSYMDTQPKFQVDVYGYKDGDDETTRTKLGTYPEDKDGYLKYSGSTASYQLYNGWNSVVVDIPEKAQFTKLEIVIREITGVESDGSLIFVDDIKFIDSTFGALEPGGDDSKPEEPSPETGDSGVLPLAMACLFSLTMIAGVSLCRFDRQGRRN